MIGRTARMVWLPLTFCASAAFGQAFDKTLFVTNNDSSTVSSMRVNYDGTLSLIGTYPTGDKPQDCALTPDGRFLVVVNSNPSVIGPEQLGVFKVNANGTLQGPVATTLVGDAPLAVGMSRSGFVLTPSTSDRTIESLLVGENSISSLGHVPAGVFPLRPISSLDSKFVYCAGSISPDDIVTFSLSPSGTLTHMNTIDIPLTAAFGIALHPNGSKLYVSTGQTNTIRWYNVNQTTGALTYGGSINPGGNSVTELAVTPDGKWLYSVQVLSDTIHTVRINADGSLSPTIFSNYITSDARDVVTDGRYVYATDETLLGGSVGVYMFQIIPQNGSLIQLGAPASTGGFKPQFMAMWAPPVCQGDSDGNGAVEFRDITLVLTNWGGSGPLGDANFDGFVGFDDVTTTLANFGECVYR
ncbi:MAG: beta-propeller fold lactonase family protein [Phycisphaerae bacterium]|nr:beta-propeller fold lactonase family protein [Phycisphaerae bacterium]